MSHTLENRQYELMIDGFDKAANVRPWSVSYQVRTTTLPLFLWGGQHSLYYIMNIFKRIYIIMVYTNLYVSMMKYWKQMHSVIISQVHYNRAASESGTWTVKSVYSSFYTVLNCYFCPISVLFKRFQVWPYEMRWCLYNDYEWLEKLLINNLTFLFLLLNDLFFCSSLLSVFISVF